MKSWQLIKKSKLQKGLNFQAGLITEQFQDLLFVVQKGTFRFHFTNKGSHPHSIHFHGIHPPEMDGLLPFILGKNSLMNLKRSHTDYKFTIAMYYPLPAIFIKAYMVILLLIQKHQENRH